MIRGFWQSRLAASVIAVLSVVVAAAVWVRDREYPVYVPVLASAMTLAIGLIAARLLGSVIANLQNTKALGLLHVELDPRRFTAVYEKVPPRLKKNSKSYVLACAYLADGYAAAGEFDQAERALCPPEEGGYTNDAALKALYYNNRCAYALGAGRTEAAEAAMDALARTLDDARLENPGLADNMGRSLQLHRNHLAAIRKEDVERTWLSAQMRQAPYRLRRLETAKVLLLDALNREDKDSAREYRDILKAEGGNTHYRAWAEQTEQ